MRRSYGLAGLRRMLAAVNVIVRRMRYLTDIDHRQQGEHNCLDQRHKDAQQRKHQRNNELRIRRSQIRDLCKDLLVGKHVCEKSNTKRERPDQITDQLDTKDQRRDQDRQDQRQPWARKVGNMV